MKYLKSTPIRTIRLFPLLAAFLIVIFGCNSAKSSSSAETVKKTEGIAATKTQPAKKASSSNTNSESIVNSFSNLDEGELKKLSDAEILQYVKEGKFVTMYAKYKNQKGEKLSKEESSLLNQNKLGLDYYVDNKGKIAEVRVRPKVLEDNLMQVQISEISTKSWKKFQPADIDCDNLPAILKEASLQDQKRDDYALRPGIDSTNAVMLASIIENCGGIPSKDKLGPTGMNTIWLLFQHGDSGFRSYYYSSVLEAAERGDLEMSKIALMQDRMLVGMQFKQWYGSQVVTSGLYPLDDPENVNKRRKKMGMEPIEEFLKKYNKTFDVEKEKLK